MTQSMEELIERVRNATGPDRGIDVALSLALNYIAYTPSPLNLRPSEDDDAEWLDYEVVEDGKLVDCSDKAPELTGSIDATLTLVEWKLPGWRLSMDQMKDGWDADLSEPGNRSGVFSVSAPTLPLAILIALLTALSSKASPLSKPEDISDDAKKVLCAFFFAGEKSTVKSNPPHAVVGQHAAAFEELIAAGLITKEAYNSFDVWLYRGQPGIPEALGDFKAQWMLDAIRGRSSPSQGVTDAV